MPATLLQAGGGLQSINVRAGLPDNRGALALPNVDSALKPVLYSLSNIVASTAIIMANKTVLSTFGFSFSTTLTLLHTVTTMGGMSLFAYCGLFTPKTVPTLQVFPLALAYVGYVILQTLSLKLNTVGFFQISKIAIMPVLILLELVMFRHIPSRQVLAAVALILLGVVLATVTDTSNLGTNLLGLVVGVAAVVVTALYQVGSLDNGMVAVVVTKLRELGIGERQLLQPAILTGQSRFRHVWAGSKQKELQTGSMQLLHQYSPLAAMVLVVMVPLMEPIGLVDHHPGPDTLLGYPYSMASLAAIAASSVLGLAVSLTTFLVIGSTSSLTYNLCGHLKTVTILAGGCLFFGDQITWKKMAGVAIAMSGIVYYTMHQYRSRRTQDLVGKPATPDVESGSKQTSFR